MSLEIPELDDRKYAEIIEDARQRIPVYSETWTDHNASDPGITILELLAWLAETYTYQLERITDAHRLKYLALLGERPRTPQPAGVELQMSLPKGIRSAVVCPSTKLVATDENEVSYGFETNRKSTLTAARLERVVVDGRQGRLEHSTANETPGMHYPAFGDIPVRNSKLYLGFDGRPFYGNDTLSLAVRLHEEGLPDPASHGNLADSWTEQVEFEPSVTVEWQYCTDYSRWFDDDVWEPFKFKSDESNEEARAGETNGEAGTDETRGFYQSGHVDVVLDDRKNWEHEGGKLFGEEEAYRWIRCVLREDGYEIAPRIDRIAVNLVPAEHRWTVEDEDGEPLKTTDRSVSGSDGKTMSSGLPDQSFRFALSATEPDERPVETLRRTYEFGPAPVLDVPDGECESSRKGIIDVNTWEQRDDFDNSGPQDEHYVLDRASGTVRFGDGSRGMIPPEGTRVTTTEYVSGGGSTGNVPPSVTWTFEGTLTDVWGIGRRQSGDRIEPTIVQTEAARGGTDAESVDEAFDRLVEDRRVPYRGVSLGDYEYLATHTPGLRFGRAAARVVEHDPIRKHRPGRHGEASYRCKPEKRHATVGKRETSGRPESMAESEVGEYDSNEVEEGDEPKSAAGKEPDDYCEPHREIRVIVVPYSRSSRPTPSDGFLDAVKRHLERHRLLTDWVTVEPPTYLDVVVDVEVDLEPGYAIPDRETAIEDALKTFLDPLRGFEGDGWPFGRTLYRSELYKVVENVRGVDCVTQLSARALDEPRVDTKGDVVVEETELLALEDCTVTARIAPVGTSGRGK